MMTKSRFNRMIQEVGGRLPCWREDRYDRKSLESEDEKEGSVTSEAAPVQHDQVAVEGDHVAEGGVYDPNWAKKKKIGPVKGGYQTKTPDAVSDTIFPRKKKSDLLMVY